MDYCPELHVAETMLKISLSNLSTFLQDGSVAMQEQKF